MTTDPSFILISTISPWLVTMLLIVVFAIFILKLPELIKFFITTPLWFRISFILILVLGSFIRFYFVPSIHRINYDEDRYLSYAITFAKFGVETNINIATPQKLIDGVPDSAARVTVPTINGWVLKIAGFSEKNVFLSAKAFSVLQIFLILILTYLLTKSYLMSIFSSFAISFIPPIVFWSTSTSLDLYFVSFAILGLIGGIWYAIKANRLSSIFLSSSILLLLFVRIEGFLMLPVIFSLIYFYRKETKQKLFSRQDFTFIVLLGILITIRALVSLSIFGKPWCCGISTPLETFMPGYFIRNAIPNLASLFIKPEFPFILTILSLISLAKNNKWYLKIMGLWFILYFLLYSSYYAGKFFAGDFSGSYGRFFLMLIPPLSILSAASVENIFNYYKKTTTKEKRMLFGLLIIVLLTLIPTLKNYKFMITTSPYERIVELDTRIFHKQLDDMLIAKTPPNSIIIHTLTAVALLNNKTAVYSGSFINDPKSVEFVIKELKQGIPAYMIQTDLCNGNPNNCNNAYRQIGQVPALPESMKIYHAPVVKLELRNQIP